jgi:hypothetical protein
MILLIPSSQLLHFFSPFLMFIYFEFVITCAYIFPPAVIYAVAQQPPYDGLGIFYTFLFYINYGYD